jgi:hypothetical protein
MVCCLFFSLLLLCCCRARGVGRLPLRRSLSTCGRLWLAERPSILFISFRRQHHCHFHPQQYRGPARSAILPRRVASSITRDIIPHVVPILAISGYTSCARPPMFFYIIVSHVSCVRWYSAAHLRSFPEIVISCLFFVLFPQFYADLFAYVRFFL